MKPIISLLLGFVLLVISHPTAWAGLVAPQGFQLGNPVTPPIETTTSISQYGITWTFADPVQYGQFVNGDYWVVPVSPATTISVTAISPGYTESPRVMNGSMINPSGDIQGYTGPSAHYSAAANVGISLPIIMSGDMSLVSTIGHDVVVGFACINVAAVLTSLTEPPPEGSFRPGISGTNKILYNESNVTANLGLLKKHAVPAGLTITAATLTTHAAKFQRVWMDHDTSSVGVVIHQTSGGLDPYYFVDDFAEAALLLHLNFTDGEKHDLLINYIQLGIDLYSYAGQTGAYGWPPDGGIGNGRKWPILFAGIMLNNAPMKSIGQISGDYINSGTFNANGTITKPAGYVFFGEDAQTFYVNQYMVDLTSGTTWIDDSPRWNSSNRDDKTYRYAHYDINTGLFELSDPGLATIGPWQPDTRNETVVDYDGNDIQCSRYTPTMLGMPEFGIRYATAPRLSDSSWGASYRGIGSGAQVWGGFVLAARMMNAQSLWNHKALFDYVDRYQEISAGRPDPFGFTVTNESAGARETGIISAMWDTYRPLY